TASALPDVVIDVVPCVVVFDDETKFTLPPIMRSLRSPPSRAPTNSPPPSVLGAGASPPPSGPDAKPAVCSSMTKLAPSGAAGGCAGSEPATRGRATGGAGGGACGAGAGAGGGAFFAPKMSFSISSREGVAPASGVVAGTDGGAEAGGVV